MVKYLISEIFADQTANSKAKDDIKNTLKNNGYKELNVNSSNKRVGISQRFALIRNWYKLADKLNKGDEVVLQVPLVNKILIFNKIVKKIKSRGVHITLIIHDVDSLRALTLRRKIRLFLERPDNIYKYADKIIVHNEAMKKVFIDKGVSESKLVVLEIFDYLISEDKLPKNIEYGNDIIVAGALGKHKAGYLYKEIKNLNFNLYGIGYTAKFDNMKYFGAFSPEELTQNLKGSYGLIWDGESLDKCTGVYGEYLKVNNPHKTSLYLASKIPVIIWKEAALADFIEKNKVGIAVDSINEIPKVLENISKDEYNEMMNNLEGISNKLRRGYFILKALNE